MGISGSEVLPISLISKSVCRLMNEKFIKMALIENVTDASLIILYFMVWRCTNIAYTDIGWLILLKSRVRRIGTDVLILTLVEFFTRITYTAWDDSFTKLQLYNTPLDIENVDPSQIPHSAINWLEAFILSRNLLLLHKQGIFYIHNYAHIIYNSGINS